MSRELISHSPDLERLQNDGYDIEVRGGHLLLKDVPYVTANREVKRGILVSVLDTTGDRTTRPTQHEAFFAGEYPCDRDGKALTKILNQSAHRDLGDGIVVDYSFSSKPPEGYTDYHQKMTTYANMLSGQAEALDPTLTAKTFPIVEPTEDESVFNYLDTASSRAGIRAISQKLEMGNVAIVGLGGTGAYVLDLVAKTPVRRIHLFDGDTLRSHNAFRSPGAPRVEELREAPPKVAFFRDQYSRMHRAIEAHETDVTEANVELLREMDFVFICIDDGEAKQPIVTALEEHETRFIDVGMGVYQVEDSLAGSLRVTTSTPENREQARKRIPFSQRDDEDDYSQNIQIADLNSLNAVLAVIKWKKLCGFYNDLEYEHNSVYEVDGNHVLNEDQA